MPRSTTLSPTDAVRELRRATKALAAADPAMRALIERAGPCTLSTTPGRGHFAALVRSIAYQQLAGKAAAAIHGRFLALVPGTLTPEAVLALSEEDMRSAGLSGAKTASIRDLAAKSLDGTAPLRGVSRLADEEIVTRLSQVRGIGRWTAEMFLLFELCRRDVWPVDDYGVRTGYKLIHDLPDLPAPKALMALGDLYRPYRSVAAWYCWEAVHLSRAR
ncbi:MAG TPA: DNA-3-methyladenine glycosylase 2 family protein [Actinobacteria bacterium]|jgi:DNA-3-methyladenine glycosylase II|nr:DNA-3-methyladenine glycosylase 2 family protein [Actinomycetota bacterium]